jgi:hypothetical protein
LSNGCSNSDIEAQQSAASLQEHIEQQVEGSSDLAARMEQLQLPPDAIQPGELISTPRSVSSDEQAPVTGDTTPTRAPSPPPIAPTDESIPDADPSVKATFEAVLLTTRVYDRVKDREIDAMSTISTTRSCAWSILSGLSLAQVSVIAVIKLPLHDSELRRFWALARPSSISTTTKLAEQYSPLDLTEDKEALYENEDSILNLAGAKSGPRNLTQDRLRNNRIVLSNRAGFSKILGRLNKELADLEREPLLNITVGPTEDNLVFNVFLLNLLCN